MSQLSVEEMLRDQIIALRADVAIEQSRLAEVCVRNTELTIRVDELAHLGRHAAELVGDAIKQIGAAAKTLGPTLPTDVRQATTQEVLPALASLVRVARELKQGRCGCQHHIDDGRITVSMGPPPEAQRQPLPEGGGKVLPFVRSAGRPQLARPAEPAADVKGPA